MKRIALWITLSLLVTAWPLFTWATQHHDAPAPPAHAPAANPPAAHAPAGHAPAAHGPEARQGEAAHGGEAHEGAHGGGHHGPPGPINWADFDKKDQPPFIALVINLAILLGLYYALGKKPIAEALKNRRAAVAKEIEEAARMRREAEQRADQYQAKLKNLEDELATAKQALVEAGKGERDRIVREAEEKAARMRKDAEFLLQQEIKQMKQDLLKDTVDVAVTAAEEILRQRVTPADQERLAEEFLADLGRAPTAPAGAAK